MGLSDPWDMQDLLQLNQHLDLTYYQSTPLSQNNFGPRKSNLSPWFYYHLIFSLKIFWIHTFLYKKDTYRQFPIDGRFRVATKNNIPRLPQTS